MKVFITKYALTKGIYTEDAQRGGIAGDGIFVKKPGFPTQWFHDKDWHKFEESAIKQANEMKKKKIASLKKQLKRIQALTFEPEIESE